MFGLKSILLLGLFLAFNSITLFAQQYTTVKIDSLPSAWTEESLFEQTLPLDDQWWKDFQDPILNALIEKAVSQNYDLLAATDRIRQSRSVLKMQQGGYYPSLDLSLGWNYQRNPMAATSAQEIDSWGGNYNSPYASLNMNWEIDLIGAVRNRAKAKKELYHASKEEYNGVMISLCAQVAQTYFALRMWQAQHQIASNNLRSQEEVLSMTEGKFSAGLSSKLDVAQAKSIYFNTKATLPTIEANILSSISALSVLMGELPGALKGQLSAIQPLPMHPLSVLIGFPADIIRRRPDIRSAERIIESQAALVGASKADWLPKLFLTASVGVNSKNSYSTFFNDPKTILSYQVAPVIKWNIFQSSQSLNAINLSKAQLEESVKRYNQVVLTAMQEVDDMINGYSKSLEQLKSLKEVVAQGKSTLELSTDLYKQGLINFQPVLDAQRSLLSYENAHSQAETQSLVYIIQLYRALGGGWSEQSVNK